MNPQDFGPATPRQASGAPGRTPTAFAQTPSQTPTMQSSAPVVSSGTGDIILSPNQKKQSPKKWIIAGIIIAILVIIIIILNLIISNRNITNSNTTANSGSVIVSQDTKTAFNKYANYLFSGEASENDFVPPEQWMRASALRNAIYNIDADWRADFLATALELQAALRETASEELNDQASTETEDEDIPTQLNNLLEQLNQSLENLISAVGQEETNVDLNDYITAPLDICVKIHNLINGEDNE